MKIGSNCWPQLSVSGIIELSFGSTQWDVPGAIPDMGDLLGVDLRHEFSVEAEQQGWRQRARRNPDRQARRWDRPCGTSSRHHGHHND